MMRRSTGIDSPVATWPPTALASSVLRHLAFKALNCAFRLPDDGVALDGDGQMRTIRTEQTRAQFLTVLAECGSVTEACRTIGIGRNAMYVWKREDQAFDHEWEAALQLGGLALEDIARERAMRNSDLLLCFLLRGIFPEKYRERRVVEVDRSGTADLKRLPRERLLQMLAELRREQDTDRLMIEGSTVRDAAPPSDD